MSGTKKYTFYEERRFVSLERFLHRERSRHECRGFEEGCVQDFGRGGLNYITVRVKQYYSSLRSIYIYLSDSGCPLQYCEDGDMLFQLIRINSVKL